MRPVLVLTATELEAAALARGLRLPPLPSSSGAVYGDPACRLGVVGLRAAALSRRWAGLRGAWARPLVVSAGLCGGLDPQLRRGDLVVPDVVMGPDGGLHRVSPPWHARALAALGARARGGRMVQTDEPVALPADKAALFGRSGAAAVDMESATILEAAAAAGCPALVVRGVSDDARDALPRPLLAAVDADGRLRRGRALGAVLACPAAWPRLPGLRRATAVALAAVAAALAACIEFSPLLAED